MVQDQTGAASQYGSEAAHMCKAGESHTVGTQEAFSWHFWLCTESTQQHKYC